MCRNCMNRREFVGLTTAGIAGGVLGLGAPAFANRKVEEWNPDKPFIVTGKKLRVQPILMYKVSQRRHATSWKSWGDVQTEEAASQEVKRISKELGSLSSNADFPLEVLPIVKVKTVEEALKVHKNDYDVIIVYPATGSGDLLRACFAKEKDKDTIIFARHRSGATYYWYEALSVRYLNTEEKESEQNNCLDHGGVHVDDVVIDDTEELLWRLRALYGLKNFIGTKIVALGGAWGKYDSKAPAVARDRYKIDIIDVSYDEAAPRIRSIQKDRKLVSKAEKWAQKYSSIPGTTLMTDKKFMVKTFLLYYVFKELMKQHEATVFTIRECMSVVIPMANTTACLTLGLLNDEGLLAFCESDFVVIPSGILLHYITGKPVFLHNSTFPHNKIVTCAHCSAPRRMDGKRYEPVKIVTHYESEYGAAPKVEIPVGQEVTFIDPEYSSGRWVGFKGIVKGNPFLEICRSQQDVEIQGDWKKLKKEVRDSHWMMAYGDYLKELGYASRKIGIRWENISQT
ncbi:MAG: sugar isomerase [Planctomycetes bacterium]|nr:sugar isomerase [Planctomycetota bacterium]